jgi:hypothetical protein
MIPRATVIIQNILIWYISILRMGVLGINLPISRNAVSGRSQDTTKYDENSSYDNGCLSTAVIACQADDNLTEYLTN